MSTAAWTKKGARVWVPVDLPRMRLTDRVTSLVAVDYLMRPQDYEHNAVVCIECGKTSFEDRGGGVRHCEEHQRGRPPVSDVAPREPAPQAYSTLATRLSTGSKSVG